MEKLIAEWVEATRRYEAACDEECALRDQYEAASTKMLEARRERDAWHERLVKEIRAAKG